MDHDRQAFEVACLLFVELVTDYLDGCLDPPLRDAMAAHLRECPDCAEYLAQIRRTVEVSGRLRPGALDPHVLADLVVHFLDLIGPHARSLESP